ncbi:hypothetical protein [Peredibacter starrii]|uniref:Uncharacterized protein n=1 Tax=Peredibacter starrii TaxID=28202 RepID=A0AAX4HN84_9BACT|nr:hypothetical protein [Peredibacter starrii]WPU64691.1 hypothetical protein SOO65_18515 [Peredibacter starrii]
MLNTRWIFMAALFSFSAMGSVSFEEKKNRVEFLEELTKSTSLGVEAFHRELNYEKLNLSLEKRAENEAQLLAEKVKIQIIKAYEAALESSGNADEAAEEIRNAVEKDLMLVSPDLQDEMRKISLDTLEALQRGAVSADLDLSNLQMALMQGVEERSNFLNEEGVDMLPPAMATSDNRRLNYTKKADILESLTSDRESVDWISSAGNTMKSVDSRKVDSKISLQVRVEFMGIGVEAGPAIAFRREYKTNVTVNTEGMQPALKSDGSFDFTTYDRMGRVVKNKRRFISFNCDADLEFETEYAGAGGFTFAGIGGSTGVSKKFSNSVNIASRRLLLPEQIAGKKVTMNSMVELCHNDFLNARVTNNLTVKGALNVMMKNMVASLRFTHPKNKCATDAHCGDWFKKEVITLAKNNNKARCVENTREKFMQCELRGQQGQSCIVLDAKGKRLSSGNQEYTCDKGLRCVQTEEAGFLSPARGKCMPIKK